jgi:hypothetical protein
MVSQRRSIALPVNVGQENQLDKYVNVSSYFWNIYSSVPFEIDRKQIILNCGGSSRKEVANLGALDRKTGFIRLCLLYEEIVTVGHVITNVPFLKLLAKFWIQWYKGKIWSLTRQKPPLSVIFQEIHFLTFATPSADSLF